MPRSVLPGPNSANSIYIENTLGLSLEYIEDSPYISKTKKGRLGEDPVKKKC